MNTSARGRAVAKYKLRDARLLQPEHWDAIETFILECHGDKGGGRVTVARIRGMLREKFSPKAPEGAPTGQELPSFDVSRGAIRYCLRHQLGYKWGKIRKKPRKRDVDRPATLRSYLLRYSTALALERAGQAVIVYFDEVCRQFNSLLSVRRFVLLLTVAPAFRAISIKAMLQTFPGSKRMVTLTDPIAKARG